MKHLALHPHTHQAYDIFVARPHHALLVEGERGMGTLTVARAIAEQITTGPATTLLIAPVNNGIAIEEIQRLYTITRASRSEPLVIIIDDADAMSRDGENALLKLLEEPPRNVYFILTSHAAHRLLATIRSRTEHLTLRPLPRKDSLAFIAEHGVTDSAMQAKLMFLAIGRPAELTRLIEDRTRFEAASARMGEAKRFLGGSAYERLLIAKSFTNSREECEAFLLMVGQLLVYTLQRGVTPAVIAALEAVSYALDALAANGNIRAQLLGVSDRVSQM